MLYRLIIENFKSFKERNEISFIPEESMRHAAYKDSFAPVLRDAVIYGANAAGKSNIVKAIDFIRKIVVSNKMSSIVPGLAFRMDEKTKFKQSLFVLEIRIRDKLYQFGIVISFVRGVILQEWLKEYSPDEKSWKIVYTRILKDEADEYEVLFKYPLNSENASRYQTYRIDIASSVKVVALYELASKNISGDAFIDAVNSVFNWFSELIIVFPNSKYNLLGRLVKDLETVNELYKKYFKIFGIDIDEIRLSEVPINYISLSDEIKESIRQDLMKDNGESMAMIHGQNQDYLAKLSSDKNLELLEVKFVHNQEQYEVEFSQAEESDGTQRLFDLIPMLGYILESNKVAIVDEIDRSLHCLLTQELLKYFLSNTEERCSQLICTTHQVILMDLKLLGRKEIWFVERNKKASVIFPLDLYKFNGDTLNVADNYLIGRFGGIPKY